MNKSPVLTEAVFAAHASGATHSALPAVGIMIGDACGIGPEVAAKAWHSGQLHSVCRPVLIGSADVLRHAAALAGVPNEVRTVQDLSQATLQHAIMDVIDPVAFDFSCVEYGRDVKASGLACGQWLDHADALARAGILDAVVMGPISSGAMKMAGTLGSIATNKPSGAYLVLRSGPLMIAHLTDHIPFHTIPAAVTKDNVLTLVRALNRALIAWGVPGARIAVAGLNPHAEGSEETNEIIPALKQASDEGINVIGPISPDSVFRHCIEGRYDVVVAMYHDQGHIAMKTWGFSGNSVVMLGPPYVHTTVAHGVAYEIAGTGQADHTMLLNAALNAAYLAAGKGFFG